MDALFAGISGPPSITWGDELRLTINSAADFWIVCTTYASTLCVEPLTAPATVVAAGAPAAVVTPEAPLVSSMTWNWHEPRGS